MNFQYLIEAIALEAVVNVKSPNAQRVEAPPHLGVIEHERVSGIFNMFNELTYTICCAPVERLCIAQPGKFYTEYKIAFCGCGKYVFFGERTLRGVKLKL